MNNKTKMIFAKRKKEALILINNFSYFSPEEKRIMTKPLEKIDSIVAFEKAYKHIEDKMNEIKKIK